MSPHKAGKHLKPGGQSRGGGGGRRRVGRAKSRRGQKNRRTKVQHRRANLTASMVIDRSRQELLSKYNIAPKKRKRNKDAGANHGSNSTKDRKRKAEGKGISASHAGGGGAGGRSVHLLPVCPTGNDEINEGELWESLRRHDLERIKDHEKLFKERNGLLPGEVEREDTSEKRPRGQRGGGRGAGQSTAARGAEGEGVSDKEGVGGRRVGEDLRQLTRNERRKLRLSRKRQQQEQQAPRSPREGEGTKEEKKKKKKSEAESKRVANGTFKTRDDVEALDGSERRAEERGVSSRRSSGHCTSEEGEATRAGSYLGKEDGGGGVAVTDDTGKILTAKKYGSIKEVFEDDFLQSNSPMKDVDVEEGKRADNRKRSLSRHHTLDKKEGPVGSSTEDVEDEEEEERLGSFGRKKRQRTGHERRESSEVKKGREGDEKKKGKVGECPIQRKEGETFSSFARRVDKWTRETLRTQGHPVSSNLVSGFSSSCVDKKNVKRARKELGEKATLAHSGDKSTAGSRGGQVDGQQPSRQMGTTQATPDGAGLQAAVEATLVWDKPAFGEVVDRPPELKHFRNVFERLREKSRNTPHQKPDHAVPFGSKKVDSQDDAELRRLPSAESKVYLQQVQAAYAALKAKRRREAQQQHMMNLGGQKRKRGKESEMEPSYSRPGWKEDTAAIHDPQWTGLGRYKPENDED